MAPTVYHGRICFSSGRSAGGFVDIRVRKQRVDSDDIPPLVPGEYLRVPVNDQGKEIPEAHLPCIFEPPQLQAVMQEILS